MFDALRLRTCAAILSLGLLSSIPGVSHGMGFGDDSPDTRIPEPSISYRVLVRDSDLNEFEVVRASFDGHIYLTGELGKAKVSVPFDKIKRVDFEPSDGSDVIAIVTLVSGKQQSLKVRGTTPCYGESDFGNVRVEIRHLKDIVLRGRAG